ncbi:HepT-like ribonuclease domain-containing protein [Mariniflexile sp.]|uniref:HepT-like ribonuclease domain-containing protein n=1 Tax=Mariniflexile sp. TaxID=1979402 RepID=UPI00404732C9
MTGLNSKYIENEINTWLEDINQAIEEIKLFLPEKRNYLEFEKDLKGKRAIERSLEIIGEAVSRILKAKADFPVTNVKKIVDTRNIISYGYDSVSDAVVWGIIVRDLDKLQAEVKNLLNE